MDPYQNQHGGPMGGGDRGRVMFNKAHSVWMGDVEPFMNEEFIRNQFVALDLKVINVRIMHSNKFQDQNLTYAFIELEDERTAIRTVQRYNDKPLPEDPRRKFKLNFTCQSQIKQAQDENGLFVGELSPDVDDLMLWSAFQERYPSVKWAKVIKDHNGISKGFGFVKFNHDEEYNKALYEMNGFMGLGSNAIRVSVATPKERRNNQGQWHSNPNNPMVAHHQQHMQYFNQATAGFQSQSDYYNYYYPQGGNYYNPQQYYDQQMRQRQDKSDARNPDLEDQGDQLYSVLRDRLVSSDFQGELENAYYSDVPLIVK